MVGETQRITIARAIVSQSSILILDEPTANLDAEAETEVMGALDKLVVGRTVLMISHRLSTVGKVDWIFVLKDGTIIEQGTYQQLKQSGGVFANLLKEQNRYHLDYAGESIIAPRAMMEQIANLKRQSALPQEQQVSLRLSRIVIEVDGKMVGEKQLNGEKPVLTIGRLENNDIPIPYDRVSRLHARLRWSHGKWVIEDAESMNGIVYQGSRIDRLILTSGDKVALAPKADIYYQEA